MGYHAISSWIFPRDNEWIFRGYRALMDLGSNSGLCLRAEAPPDLGRLLESGPAGQSGPSPCGPRILKRLIKRSLAKQEQC